MPPARSANTCMQCRARKVRCKGGPESCTNCGRLGFDCSFASSSPTPPSQPEKRRQSRACFSCRSTRTKCSGETPTCSVCLERAKPCVYPERRRSKLSPRDASSSVDASAPATENPQVRTEEYSSLQSHTLATDYATHLSTAAETGRSYEFSASDELSLASGKPLSSTVALPPLREQLQLINDFFRYLHPLPSSSFLNEVSVTQRCMAGTLDEALLLAICSLTAATLQYPKYYPDSSSLWARRVEEFIFQNIEEPTVIRTQALALIVLCYTHAGEFKRAYMFMSIAARFASALRLHYERVDCLPLAKEIRRRLLWSLMLLDMSFSIGLRESETCPPDSIYLQLPCSEELFHDGLEAGAEAPTSLDGLPEGGLLQLYVRQAIIRHDIMRLMRQVNIQTRPMPQLQQLVTDLMQAHSSSEPPQYTPAQLQRYSRSRWLPRFIAARLMWHQGICDIYRTFLTGYREGAPAVVISDFSEAYISDAATYCLRHAQDILDIINDIDRLNVELVVPPFDIGVCGYHAARLLLFLSRSSLTPEFPDITPDVAATTASQTLAIIRRLFPQSALFKNTIEDLAKIISAHKEGAVDRPRGSSEEDQGDTHPPPPRFNMAIRKHKRLSKHSALWNARFRDDGGDGLDPPASVTNLSPTSLPTLSSIQQQQLSFARSWPQSPTPSRPANTHAMGLSSNDTDAIEGESSSFEPVDFGMWDTFGSWGWGTTSFPGSGPSEQV